MNITGGESLSLFEAQEAAETDVIVRPGDTDEPEQPQVEQTDAFLDRYVKLTVSDGLTHEQAMSQLAP